MKRLLWIVVMLVVVFVPCSYADSFQITQVTGSMFPKNGDTFEHISFTFTGPGTTIEASGLMMCYPWCYIDQGLQSDTSTTPIGEVLVTSFANVILGGKTYNVAAGCCFFSDFGGFLNPSGILFVDLGDGLRKEVELTLPPDGGHWSFNFVYIPPEGDSPGGYLFTDGEFKAGSPTPPVPEPGTLGLMATGLAGITGLIRKFR